MLSAVISTNRLDIGSASISADETPVFVANGIAAPRDDVLQASVLPLTDATTSIPTDAPPPAMPATPTPPSPSDGFGEMLLAAASETAETTPSPSPPPVYVAYTVQEGDTVEGLAARHGIAGTSIAWSNPGLDADALSLGQSLRIPTSDGIVYDVGAGDTLSDIAGRFDVDVAAIVGFPGNGLASADSLAESQTIFVPGGTMAEPVATPTPTPEPEITPIPVPVPEPPDGSPSGVAAVDLGRSRIGAPYVSGAAGPNAFDCSGLVFWVYSQLGVDIPRSAPDQFAWATPVDQSDMEPGDLVFFTNTYPSTQRITHVGMYTGGGLVLMAVDNGDIVREVSLGESYWSSHFAAAGRPR